MPAFDHTPRYHVRDGFSLIEVLVALVLFSVCSVALSAGSVAVSREMARAQLLQRAAIAAQERISSTGGGACTGQAPPDLIIGPHTSLQWDLQPLDGEFAISSVTVQSAVTSFASVWNGAVRCLGL